MGNAQTDIYEYIDLGLSVKWATKNVGAQSITDYGDYFAWGEVVPKNQYDWTTYKYTESRATKMTKYNATSLGSVIDYLTELEAMDDAATVNMGSDWRTPDLNEMNELLENCTWTWCSSYEGSGISGFLVKSEIEGFTDKFIFLPAAGHYGGKNLYDVNIGCMYWTSSLNEDSFAHTGACQLYSGESGLCTMSFDRQIGMTVRGVYGPKPEQPKDYDVDGTVQAHDYVDLGLSVQWATCNIGASHPKMGGELYAWAETDPKEEYGLNNYKYSINGMYGRMSKYNKNDELTVLEPIDDAATVNWGDEWRTPTMEEFKELLDGCEWHKNIGFVYGISKINGKVIIISRSTGCRDDYLHDSQSDDGYYWTATRGTDVQRACASIFRVGYNYMANTINRHCGYAVRPVLKNKHENAGIKEIMTNQNPGIKDGVFMRGQSIVICRDGKQYNVYGRQIESMVR